MARISGADPLKGKGMGPGEKIEDTSIKTLATTENVTPGQLAQVVGEYRENPAHLDNITKMGLVLSNLTLNGFSKRQDEVSVLRTALLEVAFAPSLDVIDATREEAVKACRLATTITLGKLNVAPVDQDEEVFQACVQAASDRKLNESSFEKMILGLAKDALSGNPELEYTARMMLAGAYYTKDEQGTEKAYMSNPVYTKAIEDVIAHDATQQLNDSRQAAASYLFSHWEGQLDANIASVERLANPVVAVPTWQQIQLSMFASSEQRQMLLDKGFAKGEQADIAKALNAA